MDRAFDHISHLSQIFSKLTECHEADRSALLEVGEKVDGMIKMSKWLRTFPLMSKLVHPEYFDYVELKLAVVHKAIEQNTQETYLTDFTERFCLKSELMLQDYQACCLKVEASAAEVHHRQLLLLKEYEVLSMVLLRAKTACKDPFLFFGVEQVQQIVDTAVATMSDIGKFEVEGVGWTQDTNSRVAAAHPDRHAGVFSL
jgi:hypothetical protein